MIELISGFVLTADECCYSVGVPVQDKAGTIRIRTPKYYGTMEQAVQGTLERSLRQRVAAGEITTLRQFAEELDRQRTELAKQLAPLKPCGEAPEGGPMAFRPLPRVRHTPPGRKTALPAFCASRHKESPSP